MITPILGIYSILIIGTIYYYEEKMKDLQGSISDYKRALSLSKGNTYASHYTQLQLDNKNMADTIALLDEQNKVLQNQIDTLKLQNTELRSGIHTGYPASTIE